MRFCENSATTSQYKKVYQRKLNWFIRKINKQMEKDPLWRGRFVVKQYCTQLIKLQYSRDYVFVALIYFVDKKTGRVSALHCDFLNNLISSTTNGIRARLNKFIVEDCFDDTWKNYNSPYSDTTDYTLIDDSNMVITF